MFSVQIIKSREVLYNFNPSYWACGRKYEGWNFNSGNYLFTTDTE